jgi:hypothetical protein
VTFAVMALVLIGLAGMSVDLGNWYLHIQRTQRAADAAALDGAVFLPQDSATALDVARDSLRRNGVPEDDVAAAVIEPVSSQPAWLSVIVPTSVPNSFLSLLGMSKEQHFTRRAIATYNPPLGAGKFSNVLGNEPVGDQWEPADKQSSQGQFWLNIGGGAGWKARGDRFNVRHCFSNGPQGYVLSPVAEPSRCTGDTNNDYADDVDGIHTQGYDFIVEVPKGLVGSQVAVEAFDPSFVWQADACDDGDLEDLYNATHNPLYAPGQTPYCTGDENYMDTPDPLPTTDMQLFDAATDTPVSSCPGPRVFTPYGGPNDSLVSHKDDPAFTSVFRKWVPLCSVAYDPALGGTYRLHVSTTRASQGFNRFSLRAGLFAGSTLAPPQTQRQVRVYAKEAVPLWANFSGSDSRLALTYVPTAMAGSTIDVSFFDMGDASDPGTFSLVSMSHSGGGGGSSTQQCDVQMPNTSSYVSLPNCRLTGVKDDDGYDGYLVSVRWHVPSDYSCDETGNSPAETCYLFVRAEYPSGVDVNDATTWTVKPDGQLLRLLPNP